MFSLSLYEREKKIQKRMKSLFLPVAAPLHFRDVVLAKDLLEIRDLAPVPAAPARPVAAPADAAPALARREGAPSSFESRFESSSVARLPLCSRLGGDDSSSGRRRAPVQRAARLPNP